MMLAIPFKRLTSPKSVGIISRTLAGVRGDMVHQYFSRQTLNDLGIHPPIPLHQAEYDGLARSAATSYTLAPAAKIRLIQLDLTPQPNPFQFGNMMQRHTQALVYAGHYFYIHMQISAQAIGRLLLDESGQNRNLAAQPGQTFLLVALAAFHIAVRGLVDLKRSTKNALASLKKVGRTTREALVT